MASAKLKVLAVALACAAPAFAQNNTVAQPFAQQIAPVLKQISALPAKGKLTDQIADELNKLMRVAKSDAEIGEVTFIQQDIVGYLSSETKPSNVAIRKRCLADMMAGNQTGSFDRTQSKACSAITDAVYP